VLAVMEEGLRHGGLAAVVGEVGRADMASTRRLQLAAEEGGTPALMLKRWRKERRGSAGLPSAAVTRWRIGCAPFAPLAGAGVGRARWRVALARQRGGEPHRMDHGGLRCRGSPRSSCRLAIDRIRRTQSADRGA
jgi:protein ImuA